MVARNDITGDSLTTKTTNDKYRDGWDRIFGNKSSHITPSDGNVFADLGFPGTEASDLLAAADKKIKNESRDSSTSAGNSNHSTNE